ncbi:hypothetical protein [Planctomicrobium piriforme]|uniref:Uncharacterized protein n=1 Tax=Planctomicrobium piriforme TaxID=1576369 RepID=A0A1I3QJD0_9PLAN|nr:hypothetical protein [Planctomicrobium piriforme]SFJ34128.1 hypothetical protein SAMN05421753_118119 [Planctomicrobium piriforme]
MKKIIQWLGFLFLILVAVLWLDYIIVEAKENRVSAAVSRAGGRMGSIPFWPIGAEYRITFPRALTVEQLNDVAKANSLRGSVGIAFVDCELSDEETRQTRQILHKCHVFRVQDGKWLRLSADHQK